MKYELSALIDADSLFYGVYDAQRVLHLAETTSLTSVADDMPWSAYGIAKAKTACVGVPFAVVPSNEYSSAIGADILAHVSRVSPSAIIRNDYCPTYDVRVVYAIESQHIHLMHSALDQVSMYHYITALIDGHTDDVAKSVIASLVGDHLYLVATERESLHLAICEHCSSDQHILYYISLVYQQLGWDAHVDPLYLSGTYSQSQKELIERYIQQVVVEEHSMLTTTVAHHYQPLHTISLCA